MSKSFFPASVSGGVCARGEFCGLTHPPVGGYGTVAAAAVPLCLKKDYRTKDLSTVIQFTLAMLICLMGTGTVIFIQYFLQ